MIDHAQLLDHLSIGIIVVDEPLTVVFWNRWMEEHSLLPREEVRGKPLYELFPDLVKKEFTAKAREAFRKGEPTFFTHKVHQFMFPFHTVRSLLASKLSPMQQTVILSPLKDDDGVTRQLLVSVFDISDWVAYQNRLLESKKELEKLSRLDDLTQIANRRAIMEQLRYDLCLHARKKRPLAMALIDIDHFKKVNDTYGHQCGDQLLRGVAQLLAEQLRGYDKVGRYGGEEFMLVLPETSREAALQTCERLRQKVAATVFQCHRHQVTITVSIGTAFFGGETAEVDQHPTAEDLFRVADANLYRAKDGGRDRVEPRPEQYPLLT